MRAALVLLVGCAPAPVAVKAISNHVPCTIYGFHAEDPELMIHGSPDGNDPLLRAAAAVEVTWTQLPVDVAHGRARVALEEPGFDATGWASIAHRAFRVEKRVAIVPGHVWAAAGSRVTILGAVGSDSVSVAIPTLFDDPRALRATVGCSDIGEPDMILEVDPDRVVESGYDLEMCGRLDLFASPDGPQVFSATSSVTWDFERRESKAGFEHIVGCLGTHDSEMSHIELDGWQRVPGAGDPVCQRAGSKAHLLHGTELAPDDERTRTVTRDTPVLARPGGPPLGVVAAGAKIEVIEQRDDFVQISLSRQSVAPAAGGGFYLRADALSATAR